MRSHPDDYEPTTTEQIFGIIETEDPLQAKRRRLGIAGSAYDAALREYLDELSRRILEVGAQISALERVNG